MKKQEKAILIDVIDTSTTKEEAEIRLMEMESLVYTFGGVVVIKTIQKRGMPDYDTYIGSGKLNEIHDLAEAHEADVLIINNLLKARQLFTLNEKLRDIDVKAWDRVDLNEGTVRLEAGETKNSMPKAVYSDKNLLKMLKIKSMERHKRADHRFHKPDKPIEDF